MTEPKKKETARRGRPPNKVAKELKEEDVELLMRKKRGEKDACDCFMPKCPGCWYPCVTCGSSKCSPFCRTTRLDEKLEWTSFS